VQHYAALGRDEDGGRAVNLVHTKDDVPQDVYSKVLERVVKRVHEDALQGVKAAVLLDGKIDRKVVKQTVMTSVYGVTQVGAREQIRSRLLERKLVPDDATFECSHYLAKQTLSGLADLFSSAFNIMQWLATCADLIAKEKLAPTAWTTPLGLPVVQPYHKKNYGCVRTIVQNITLAFRQSQSPVARGQQKSAFPPNFVHSLDSTHMLLTALECDKENITFAAVHDCFWTHPSNVDRMNQILRQQFVSLHSKPVLENLRSEFVKQHPDVNFPPLPERGSLDLKQVLNSPYFFD
jgi:DNA-directed RNA polymerase